MTTPDQSGPELTDTITGEAGFIRALRAIATNPAARALSDDAAVLPFGTETLVLTLDTVVEGVHFLPHDPPEDIAWKLVAVNVSDLSAKSAEPVGCLYSHALGDVAWDQAFLTGLQSACAHFAIPLLGGDTVRMPQGCAKSFSLTALGRGPQDYPVPSRTAAKAGDDIWVSGTIGDAGLGLAVALGQVQGDAASMAALLNRYRRPQPTPRFGCALAPYVHAMMDISDGVLVDAMRMGKASTAAISIKAEAVPLSAAHLAIMPDTLDTRITAMTAGDDYELLFTAAPEHASTLQSLAQEHGCPLTRIGHVSEGEGLHLSHLGQDVPLPERLGYQH